MYYIGVDVGSVSTDIVILDENMKVIESLYLKTRGNPLKTIKDGFKTLQNKYDDDEIKAVGTTGSGRQIASFLVGADAVKNEITAHAVASLDIDKNVRTIIEIGGQDSKIIILRDGIVTDFAMNTVCAAGTGSFLDRQAERLSVPIEEFGDLALQSKTPVRIAGRCAVFAESDMIHKQQVGYKAEDIIRGLCEALVRNYLNNIAKGKELKEKIFFQGGVAANVGMKSAFERELGVKLYVPEHYNVMGAIGAAIIGRNVVEKNNSKSNFKGFKTASGDFHSKSFECNGCSNRCEVVKIIDEKNSSGCFGDRCGKWSNCS
ncbi:R-phenyllactate dehydratase activator [Clostridium pasteurianum DSM 525 = ATCC 6013]|uniref:CoA-substrate-specific enzyme activase n=1 Tax=Clostridium pasteurianum DSM 525 = ATCC 6013 TaxID=1262449 RepID=A0A0H3J5Q8_CLOPA|nr:acyl-CoA dehydratase activase [Clostridium pasteurianum]AJA49341.1 R-phenyllactate dehydratase activator [Clostridium pasteurianum DSM 525 = ATCC 6013]AJA53329.1 R-phenyllactate dehydratase activator [Clostridium pasteurianum DSM 525 = ATCC 6013]AOZ76515.1 2-hydroxyglutaryl-CoA dehydratase [Clostridium pasteurianum DSM 525 = ATCC 6013]AOZ80312.1 2-hydroxyglutaryl-CoA dehydratase [Clostridium pasteurianum]ELP58361.1 CoA-substrate-specific enzyme activase [Clostridium pasteurianum DSM 525 = A